MKQRHALKTVNSIIFYLSCLLLLAACWQRNDFPEDLQLDARLPQEPVQISNNHLLIDNPHYRKLLRGIRIGDQVRVRGWPVTRMTRDSRAVRVLHVLIAAMAPVKRFM